MHIERLLISIILLLSVTAFNYSTAQSYRPMLAQFNEWQVTSCSNGCLTDVYYTNRDTSFDGYTYHILDGFHYISGTFLLREDTAARQVFLYLITGNKDGEEYLLYDFSLNPGDSMQVFNPISPYPSDAGYFLLDSIVTKTHIDNEDYRHFYLSSLDTVQSASPGAIWIEGIGSRSLINTPGGPPSFSNAGSLSCFFNNLTLHYSNLDSINACVQQNTDLSIYESDASFQFYPNPVADELIIKFKDNNEALLEFYNTNGMLEASRMINSDTTSVDVSALGAGIYLLRVVTNSEIVVKRLVVL